MEIIHNAIAATIAGTTIVVSSIFGITATAANDAPVKEASTVSVCGSAGLLPADVQACP